MKATKFIILVGGNHGLLSFFLPLVAVHDSKTTSTVSAMQIIKGVDTVSVSVDSAEVHSVRDVEVRGEAKKTSAR